MMLMIHQKRFLVSIAAAPSTGVVASAMMIVTMVMCYTGHHLYSTIMTITCQNISSQMIG